MPYGIELPTLLRSASVAWGRNIGPELVLNGTFDDYVEHWEDAYGGSHSYDNGTIEVDTNVAGGVFQVLTVEMGATYTFKGQSIGGTADRLLRMDDGDQAGAGGTDSNETSTGANHEGIFVAGSTTAYIYARIAFPGDVLNFDNISVRKVLAQV
jgi:hypothetical protein